MRRASPAARPRQARKATGPGGEMRVKGCPHLGGQGGVLRLRGTGLCPQWAGAPLASTLGGYVHGKPGTEPNLEWRSPQVETEPWVGGQRGSSRRLPLSLSSRLAVPDSSSVQAEFSGNKITGCS